MGKTEKGTPKDIANRMKAKGLQKLRWYCQMCQKQCRDENGFKCHTNSESHQRQLLLFAENPDKYLDSFSEEFFDEFLTLLRRRFGTKRVHANNVYQEYIHDKDHIHMNSTQWETLTEFVKWLGREGHCIVDETEKGWFVACVDRDPETLLRQKQLAKKEKFEKDEQERFQEFINKQVVLGKMREEGKEIAGFSELKRDNEDDTISLGMKISSKAALPKTKPASNPLTKFSPIIKKERFNKYEDKRKSALAEIIEEEQKGKRYPRRDNERLPLSKEAKSEKHWLVKDIVVKVITKDLGSKYYKEKGLVVDVIDKYGAIIKLLSSGTKLKLDQSHLETVVPGVGRDVLFLLGPNKNQTAFLKSIQVEKFCAILKITSGPNEGRTVEDIPYEHFSKLYS